MSLSPFFSDKLGVMVWCVCFGWQGAYCRPAAGNGLTVKRAIGVVNSERPQN